VLRLGRLLPIGVAAEIARFRNILLGVYFFQLCRRHPQRARKALIDIVRKKLGPDYDVDTHFTPQYGPWEQRLCVVPNSDLFRAIRCASSG
jgi:cation diffusion facilitator CzcD-associated flavoprotein CzcO